MKLFERYKYKIFEKNINIFKTGYGIVFYNIKMEVLAPTLNRIPVSFWIDAWTREKISLKPFEKFEKRVKPFKDIFSTPSIKKTTRRQAFYFSFKEEIPYEIKVIKDTDIQKEMRIIPKDKFKKGDIIEYSWGWRCPSLYPNSEEARRIDEEIISGLIFRSIAEKVIFNIRIEKGHPLAKKVFRYEKWVNNKTQASTVIKKREELKEIIKLKVEIKNVKPSEKYLIIFESKK